VDPGNDTSHDLGEASAGRNAAELRQAAETLRGLVPQFRGGPVSEFVPLTVAALLQAIADSLDDGKPVSQGVRESALAIARHLRTYGPTVSDR
jgi:hypothetical protein